MKTLMIALVALFVVQVDWAAAQAGDPQAGERQFAAKLCRNCHGDDNNAEGAFGPDLAGGRGLTLAQFRHAVRNPWGVMLSYTEEQLSDQQVADIYAYVQTKPPVPSPGEWHWPPAPDSAPLGQRLYMNTVGCGQCHEPENGYGRMWLGEHAKEVDFDYFAKQIYEHTEKYPRGGMGNYSRARLPEPVLREIYQWMVVDLGMRASVSAAVQVGERMGNQTTMSVTVRNNGVENVGLDVEGITLFIKVPDGLTVASGSGTGYAGVQPLATLGLEPRLSLAPHPHDDTGRVERPEQDLSGDVAVWKIPALAAGQEIQLSFALEGPELTAEVARGFSGSTIHWETPGRTEKGKPPALVYRDLRLPDEGDHESVRLPRIQ